VREPGGVGSPAVELLTRALASIDAANAEDPIVVTVRDRTGPKEIVHAELVTEWVQRMRPDADDALLLAARGHHFRRWTTPRGDYPAGRSGYLRWRKAAHDQHADELGAVLRTTGYDDATILKVQQLVRKQGLGTDPDVQTLEDALCLVFLETQFADVATRLEPDTLANVIVKTANKMSDAGRAYIGEIPLAPLHAQILDAALARDVVHRYLVALQQRDWDGLRSTLAPDVHRMGPYRDAYDGRDPYADFLAATLSTLSGYELEVSRFTVDGRRVVVELSETVDDGDARLRTDEAVVFDVERGQIARVAVYLQTSERS
jgi:limonene-1,2-epoxide hydrolase